MTWKLMTIDLKRQTGRTTRMLEEALRLAREGRHVYVVAVNQHQAHIIRADLAEGRGSITVGTPRELHLDWSTLEVDVGGRGYSEPPIVLVDHYAIEYHLGPAMKMLTRFDTA
jgi:K+-sensing histidine kinase KdpD